MTPKQLKGILAQYGIEMYSSTGGIYSKDYELFLGSIDPREFVKLPLTVTKVSLSPTEVQAKIDLQKIVRSVCVLHDIAVKEQKYKGE